MSKVHPFSITSAAALIFLATSIPLHAEGLGGLGQTVGGALGGVGQAVGNTVGAVGNTVNGLTGTVGNTTTSLGALDRRGVLSADAKSDIINGIMAKARVLSPKELARLCLGTGGGDKGCGSGNRPRILGLIDARLEVLSNKRLIGVCVTVGAGCGGSSITRVGSAPIINVGSIPGQNIPQSADANLPNGANIEVGNIPGQNVPQSADATPPNATNQTVADMSDREIVAYKMRCASVLKSPQKYEDDIVSICRLIKRQKV